MQTNEPTEARAHSPTPAKVDCRSAGEASGSDSVEDDDEETMASMICTPDTKTAIPPCPDITARTCLEPHNADKANTEDWRYAVDTDRRSVVRTSRGRRRADEGESAGKTRGSSGNVRMSEVPSNRSKEECRRGDGDF